MCTKLSPIGIPDHCLFKCTTSAKKLKLNVSYAYLPNLSPINRALFHNTMNNIDFVEETVITDGLSLHLIFDTLLATLTSAYDYCFPLRKIKIYNNIPWITNSIRQMMKLRDNACRRGNAAVFKHYRKKVKEAILRAKAKYCA